VDPAGDQAMKPLVLLLLLLGGTARAECDLEEPAAIALRENDAGAPRLPCAVKRFDVRLRGGALIDLPEFYGTLDAAVYLGVRWPVGRVELSVAARVVDWRFVQNASLQATELGLGPVSAGILVPLRAGRWHLAPSLRLILPFTDTAYDVPAGTVEAGFHAGLRASLRVTLLGGATFHTFVTSPPGTVHARGALALSAGTGLELARWFRVLAGVEVAGGWFGAGLDHLLVRGGLRFVSRRAGSFDLVVAAPLAGEERTNLVLGLDWSLPL
jgi:hypothetical protein